MVIIKYNEWLIFNPDRRSTTYELCRDDFTKVRKLDKEEAIELIRKNGLKRVHRDRYGAIWK